MNDELLLGLDVGTTNCKALLFDLEGRPIAMGSVPTPTLRPRPNWAEFDPQALWEAVVAALRQALVGIDAQRVRGVAVASMAEAGVLLDQRGQPTYPIIAWYDSRTVPQHDWWVAHVDAADSFAITGVKPEPIYSIFKLMWLRDHAPAAYRTATRWLNVADYIAFRLCGAQATDYSLATRMMLLDLERRCWSDVLVERAGLRRDLLAELVPSGTHLGGVTIEAAETTGLRAGTSVGSGGMDHICGALAVGMNRAGLCLDSMGTAETVFLPLDTLRLDNDLARSGCTFGAHVARDRYYCLDGIWTSGAAVEWAARLLAWPQVPGVDTNGSVPFEQMQATAATVSPGSEGVFFLPRLAGGNRGAFVGLTVDTGAATLGRAVYEGLAFEWRRYLDQLEAALGIHTASIRLIGGGTRSSLLVQIKADVLGRPLRVVDLEESVALGAALLGGLAAGIYRDETDALARLHYAERIVTPNPERALLYDRRYRQGFLHIAPALEAVHGIIKGLTSET